MTNDGSTYVEIAAKATTLAGYGITDAIPASQKGATSGVATLGSDGKVPASQLPSFVDDVMEYANQAGLPATGETGKIYVTLDTNKIYRWSGSTYVEISSAAASDTAVKLSTARTIGMTGDVTWTSGAFDGSANVTGTATLTNSGVTAGTYKSVTVDAKGRVTAGTNPTTLSGYGITDAAALSHNHTMLDLPSSAFKRSVRVATTANITLSGSQTIDGVAVVAGDRVLVKDQTTSSQNGIYNVSASTWTRAADADASDEIASAIVNVEDGTANGGKTYMTTFKVSNTVGTTGMVWFEVATLNSNVASATILQTGRTIGMTGDVTWTSGSFNGSANVTGTATLASSGVTAGTYKSVTVDAKGRVTAGTNPTTLAGYGITDAYTKTEVNTAISAANKQFSFTMAFTGSNPSATAPADLPSGWTYVVSGADVTITHNVGKPLASVQYWGVSTTGGVQRYRLPSASNEVTIPIAEVNTKFTFRVTTAVAGADTDGSARVVVTF